MHDHADHTIIADYVAQACHLLFATVAAERVVIGGGVAKTAGLVDRIRVRAAELGAGYLPGTARHRIHSSLHRENAGIIGAMMLAQASQ